MRSQATEEEIGATYRAIGRFVVEYSELEYMLRFMLGVALGLRMDLLEPVIAHDYARLCTAVLTIFKQTVVDEEKYKGLKKLINKCRGINDLRVKVVHGSWQPERKGGTLNHVSRSDLRGASLIGMRALLEEKADETRNILNDLDNFLRDHQADKRAIRQRRKKMAALSKLFG
jgi:hypothetical protein